MGLRALGVIPWRLPRLACLPGFGLVDRLCGGCYVRPRRRPSLGRERAFGCTGELSGRASGSVVVHLCVAEAEAFFWLAAVLAFGQVPAVRWLECRSWKSRLLPDFSLSGIV